MELSRRAAAAATPRRAPMGDKGPGSKSKGKKKKTPKKA
jgi:hypothetical protein